VAEFEPVLLARVEKPGSESLASYRADGGYKALEAALRMAPKDVIQLVKDSGLRGRGGRISLWSQMEFLPEAIRGRFICVSTPTKASRGRSTIGC
jgi:NADH:ubiquinone oxidoreductase subunit F (NADH-binding)